MNRGKIFVKFVGKSHISELCTSVLVLEMSFAVCVRLKPVVLSDVTLS